MRIKISKIGYQNKPTVEDMKSIQWHFKTTNCIDVTFTELINYISSGHSFILADYIDGSNSVKEEYIQSLSCIALDVDSKENKITKEKMIRLIEEKYNITPILAYNTFSDVDNSKFRLIYKFENNVDVEVYKKMYKAFQWKFKKYLDPATGNANRVWAGTNKGVLFNCNHKQITFNLMIKLINSYDAMIKREENKKKKARLILTGENSSIDYTNNVYIRPQFKEIVLEYLVQNIDLKDFIQKYFGGHFKRVNNSWVGACPLHGGDNKNALVISENIYTCFTHCGTGNIITLGKMVYKDENFSNVALKLANEYNLHIPSEYIREV